MKAVLESINSKTDVNGNRYFSFVYTDCNTNKTVSGIVSGGESNIRSIIRGMGFESKDVYFTSSELPIREYNRLTKDFGYAGCTEKDLTSFIKSQLGVL